MAKGAAAAAPRFPVLAGHYLGMPDPGLTPRIFAPGIVSTEEHETNIAFAPDGRELCVSGLSLDQARRWIRFMRLDGGRWTPPEAAPFSSAGADFEASYAAGGRQLYLFVQSPAGGGGSPRRDMDIWVVDRAGEGWGEPRNLGPGVNGASNEYMPTLDRDGNLYFERFGLNVARPRAGAYAASERVVIPNAVNPGHPFVSPDGGYLVFDARPAGPDEGPSSVLFVSFRTQDGSWSPAVRLFESSDAREYESCPTVSPDGEYLFFGRDHDIFWVRIGIHLARLRSRTAPL